MQQARFNVCVFSGGSAPIQKHLELANELGVALALNKFGLVNGGGPGLMEQVAKSVFTNDGFVTGIHYELEGREKSQYNTETISYSNQELRARQLKILELSDAFIAIPGGLGTLYEIIEVMSLKYVNNISNNKPLILLDRTFWQPFVNLIDSIINQKYANQKIQSLFTVVDSIDEAISIIKLYEKSK